MYFKNDPWKRPWCYFRVPCTSKLDVIRWFTSDKYNPKAKKEYVEHCKAKKQMYMTWMGGDSSTGRHLSVYDMIIHGYKLNYCELFKN